MTPLVDLGLLLVVVWLLGFPIPRRRDPPITSAIVSKSPGPTEGLVQELHKPEDARASAWSTGIGMLVAVALVTGGAAAIVWPAAPSGPIASSAGIPPGPGLPSTTETGDVSTGSYRGSVTVVRDPAGHRCCVKPATTWSVLQTGDPRSGDLAIRLGPVLEGILLTGGLSAPGATFTAVGYGTVAGHPGTEVSFTGSATPEHGVHGTLTVGANHSLPTGQPIIFSVDMAKLVGGGGEGGAIAGGSRPGGAPAPAPVLPSETARGAASPTASGTGPTQSSAGVVPTPHVTPQPMLPGAGPRPTETVTAPTPSPTSASTSTPAPTPTPTSAANQISIVADSTRLKPSQQSAITVTVTDPQGHPVNADTVTFSVAGTNCSTLTPATAQTDNGVVHATYVAGRQPATCTITAKESATGRSGSLALTQTGG